MTVRSGAFAGALALAAIAASPSANAQDVSGGAESQVSLVDAETSLACGIWAAIHVGQVEDEESKTGFSFTMTWLLGRYEGLTGKRFDRVAGAADIEKVAARFGEYNEKCLPVMLDIGERMQNWGSALPVEEAKEQAPE